MKMFYIAPSIMPSRSANSIHVARMCEALASLGHEVTLFFRSSLNIERGQLKNVLEKYYGVNLEYVKLVSFMGRFAIATNLRIALLSLRKFFLDLLRKDKPELIISRNLYASFFIGVLLRHPIIFETHQLEPGLHKFLQNMIIKRPWIATVVISRALKQLLTDWHGVSPVCVVVLHDAAPVGITVLSDQEKQAVRQELLKSVEINHYRAMAGYFGHLYPGRGIGIIQSLAKKHPNVMFLVFGGNDEEIERFRVGNVCSNLHFMGHIEPSKVASAMGMCDVLLMPYQKKVSIGIKKEDTGRWMSPMKMFEYMASGVPIIASKLPALEEVLVDRRNCLLAVSHDPVSWSDCLNILLNDPKMAEMMAENAHAGYVHDYNWITRAQKMIEQAPK